MYMYMYMIHDATCMSIIENDHIISIDTVYILLCMGCLPRSSYNYSNTASYRGNPLCPFSHQYIVFLITRSEGKGSHRENAAVTVAITTLVGAAVKL